MDSSRVWEGVYDNLLASTSAPRKPQDLLEIGDVPFVSTELKPKRADALRYYRRVVDHFRIPVKDHELVLSVRGSDGDFTVKTRDRFEVEQSYQCDKVIVAIGYYDNPNMLGITGEDLPKVSHYYSEPHPYYRKKVAIIGGKNSAVEAALELYREGAEVILIHRGPEFKKHIKYWVLPDILNRINNGEIDVLFSSEVVEIQEQEIIVETPNGRRVLENDFVLAMTGYHPDADFLRGMGIELDPENFVPVHDEKTLETNVKGIYVAGAVVAGTMTNLIFIENGRFHGPQIFKYWPSKTSTGA